MSTGRAADWTLGITCAAAFMEALDMLVVTTALPEMGRDLGATFTRQEWVISAYALAVAVFLFTGGALGERYGRRRIFIGGVLLFTAGSVLAAVAPNEGILIAARAVQGVGTAIVTPVSLTLILAAFPPARIGMALGVWAGVVGTGVGIGPLVGGAITDQLNWHWIFWINVPVGIVTIVLSVRRMNESARYCQPLDPIGLLLIGGGLLSVVNGAQGAGTHGWSSARTVTQLVVGGLLVLGFFAWESRTREPMFPLALLRIRTFASANVASFLMGASLFSAGVLVAQYFQIGRGYSPVQSGLGMLPWTATPILLSPVAGQVADRIGNRPFITAGLGLQGIGLGWFGLVADAGTGYWQLLPALIAAGIGISLVFPTVASASLGAVGPHRMGVASATANAVRQVGGAIGIAAVGAVFTATGGLHTPQTVAHGIRPALLTAAALSILGAVMAAGVTEPATQRHLVSQP